MAKKLYRCELRFTYYAVLDDPSEASDFCDEAIRDSFVTDLVTAYPITNPAHRPEADWDERCLVYHGAGGDLTLGEALKKYTGESDE